MIPGPVFSFELLTTARRGRFYVMRAAYAVLLLMIFWSIYAGWSATAETELTPSQMSWFAIICFCSVAVAQVVLVLALTPAMVAGVIADERQRKTLHYLLASRLSGPEIVVGKLLARMLHVAVLLSVGFPVLSLLVLLGGIDPWLILVACSAAASTAWFLAALAIWASTIARRVREALFITYGLEFLWLFIPLMSRRSLSVGWAVADQVIETLLEWLTLSSPIGPGRRFFFALLSGGGSVLDDLTTMIAFQVGAGAVLAALAAWLLRPVFRAQEGAGFSRRWFPVWYNRRSSTPRWTRPALGDRPMLWKELFTSRARGFARLVGTLVTLVGGGFYLYYAIWYFLMAFLEMWERGYWIEATLWYSRPGGTRFLWFLQFTTPLVYLVGIFSVAGAAASAITSEHEEDTWTSLTSTDLTGREIILSKLVGALWRPRVIVVAIFLSAFAGIMTGSVHPLSMPFLGLSLAVYGWFAAALGVWISLHLRSTWRAQFLTISCLLLINLSGQAILSNVRLWAPLLMPGFTPYEISKAILPYYYRGAWTYYSQSWSFHVPDLDNGPIWKLIFTVLGLMGYLAGAITLTWLSLSKFETVAGRARPARQRPSFNER
jgi:ABC-type transport system involved in multi-copper enzyme maturation permease subunit